MLDRTRYDAKTLVKCIKLARALKELVLKDLDIPDTFDLCICDIGNPYGCTSTRDNTVYISDSINNIDHFIKTVLHEHRHVYQVLRNRSILNNYNYTAAANNTNEYREHPAEVDANEYAKEAMVKFEKEIQELKNLYRRNQL